MKLTKVAMYITAWVLLLLITHNFVTADEEIEGKININETSGKIIGGRPTEISNIPYQVSISRVPSTHFCGGSIISANHVLTAAHCVYGMRAQNIFVRSGSSLVNQGGSVNPVSKITIHPRYNSRTIDNDLAVLRTSRAFASSKIIRLATSEPPAGSTVLISGWGVKGERSRRPSKELQSVEVKTVDRRTCQAPYLAYNRITSNMLCAGVREGGKDACQGDSGGPLAFRGEQVAVTSWGRGCGRRGFYGVYASIPANLQWIRSAMGQRKG